MISVHAIQFVDILDSPNAPQLMAEYDAECSLAEIGPINPQQETYVAMERSGAFQCFGVYTDWPSAESLVGFASAITYAVPHYGKRIATVESLFLASAHRKWRTGNKLMNAIEEYAREKECVVILYSAPANSQFEKLLRLLKPYRHSNTVFLRAL